MEDPKRNDSDGAERAFVRPPLRVRGARTHNLKNVDVDIPRNQTTVFSGPSGGGKSSLVYDTIFAEGQRQYLESLSVQSRRFVNPIERPDFDTMTGLLPSVAISQRPPEASPRGTTATVTEIYDYLRLLYARVGTARCSKCGRPVQRQTLEQIQRAILSFPQNTRFMLLAPIVRDKRGGHADVLARLVKRNYSRARIDGALVELADVSPLDPKVKHTIEAVIDRLILREGVENRLAESLALTLREGDGFVCCLYEKERLTTEAGTTRSVWKDALFSERYSCPKCGTSCEEFEPRSFSFNSRKGACPNCSGLGRIETFDPATLVADRNATLDGGALAFGKATSVSTQRRVAAFLEDFKTREPDAFARPIGEWDEALYDRFFYGEPRDEDEDASQETLGEPEFFDDTLDDANESDASLTSDGAAPLDPDRELLTKLAKAKSASRDAAARARGGGLIDVLEACFAESKSVREKAALASFRGVVVCNECGGSRLRQDARCATVADKRISDATAMTVADALKWFRALEFNELQAPVATPIVEAIVERLETMIRLRLEYLTLDRPADTLSGGEMQRARLATALGNGLSGVCYLLDEPTAGLHPRDVARMLEVFDELKARGNTVVLVEHNEQAIRSADRLFDVGPGAGVDGGRILAVGTPDEVATVEDSPTGRFLSGRSAILPPKKRRKAAKTRSLVLEGARTNNLKNVTATFPLGLLICVTGVSGSGKSSLVVKTLASALRKRLRGGAKGATPECCLDPEVQYDALRGASKVEKLTLIDRSSIGRSPRSAPSTYSGVFDEIRKLYASTPEARAFGFKAGRFSFNIAGGRCEECQGCGVVKSSSSLSSDFGTPCPVCQGKRFNSQTLRVKYREKSIADVLDMTFADAAAFFENHATISRILKSFINVGLGYMSLGRPASTLSGGEAQRVKLATELSRVDVGAGVYILDEPTSGLHPQDVQKLLEVLQHLVDSGNTVIVVEHSLDVMKVADWIIDVGPEGGEEGGRILASGSPEEIAAIPDNETARFLRAALSASRRA